MSIKEHKQAIAAALAQYHAVVRVHEAEIARLRAKRDSTPSGQKAKARREKRIQEGWAEYREAGRCQEYTRG